MLTSCFGHRSEQADSAEILIGEYGALTGNEATLGISTQNGIDMAFDKANTSGGVLGKKIRVVVEDDRGKPEEAQTVVSRLITKYGVSAILGAASSTRSLAAAPIAQQSHIPMVTPAATNLRVTKVGDYIFRTCFTDAFPSSLMAKFVSNNLSITKLAILRDIRNDYSVDLADIFTKDFKKLGGTIVADEGYGEGDIDFSAQLTKIKSRNPQAIFIPSYYTEVALIARQARQLGMTLPLLGSGSWDSPRLLEIGGEALEGSYYFNHFSAGDSSNACATLLIVRPVLILFYGTKNDHWYVPISDLLISLVTRIHRYQARPEALLLRRRSLLRLNSSSNTLICIQASGVV